MKEKRIIPNKTALINEAVEHFLGDQRKMILQDLRC